MSRKKSNKRSSSHNVNNKRQKLKFDDIYKLDEEDDAGYPQIQYDIQNNANSDSDSSEEDFRRIPKSQQQKQNSQQQAIQQIQSQDKNVHGQSQYAKQQQQHQVQYVQKVDRRSSIENIQEKFKMQIERKQRQKEKQSTESSYVIQRLKEEDESKLNSKLSIQYIEGQKATQVNIPDSNRGLEIQSARASFKQLPNFDVNTSQSIKNSMADVLNIQLTEMSDARKRDFEMKKMKQQEQNIIEDSNISEDQRRVKLDNLKHSQIVDKVKNIIEKTKKMKEQQYKPANREMKFEMSLNIFKKLDTYLETKGYLQKINKLNDQNKLNTSNTTTQNANENETHNKKKKKDNKIFQTKKVTGQNDDYQNKTYAYISNILQKSHKYLNNKNKIILSQDQVLGGCFLSELEKSILGQNIKEQSEQIDEQQKFSKQNYENISQQDSQSDTNAFYGILQYQLQSGYFQNVENEKKKVDITSSSSEQTEEDEDEVEKIENTPQIEDKHKKVENKQDLLDAFRKNAKKITQMLLHTSKSILKKNIEKTNNAVTQARQARANQSIQSKINIRHLEKSIKELPQKLSRLEYLKMHEKSEENSQNSQNIQNPQNPPKLSHQPSIEIQIDKENMERKQEALLKQKLLKEEMIPLSPSAKKKNIDQQLQNLEDSISSLNSSKSIFSDDVKKISLSFERTYSEKNENQGNTPTAKQSTFFKMNQEQSPKNEKNKLFLPQLQNITANGSPKKQNQRSYSLQSRRDRLQISNVDSINQIKMNILLNKKLHEQQPLQILKEINLQRNEKSPLFKVQTRDIFAPSVRPRHRTNDSTFSKQSNTTTHQKKQSISQHFNSKSPTSYLSQTGIFNYESSPFIQGISSKREMVLQTSPRIRTEVIDKAQKREQTIKEQIEKSKKQNGFSVINIKQIISDIRQKEKTQETKNKFTKLQNQSYTQSNKRDEYSFLSPLLMPLSSQHQKSKTIQNDILEQFKLDPKSQKKIDISSSNLIKEIPENNIDFFKSLKSQYSQKQIQQQPSSHNIFLTENVESPKLSFQSDKFQISSFLPPLSAKRSISNSNGKRFSFSKTRDFEQKMSRSSSIQNVNIIQESNKQLEQIISNINSFKINYKQKQSQISKQITDLQLEFEQQQENFIPKPLESLRICIRPPSPQTFKSYQYNRKAVQKIL